MNIFSKINAQAIVAGILLSSFGINVVVRGNIWNIVLGYPERYFVGGVAVLVGGYVFVLGLRNR